MYGRIHGVGRVSLEVGSPIPLDVYWLNLEGAELPLGTLFPDGLWRLDLGGGSLPPGMRLPPCLHHLNLGGGSLPIGTELPASLRVIDLEGGSLPDGMALPEGLEFVYLGGGSLAPNVVWPRGLKVYQTMKAYAASIPNGSWYTTGRVYPTKEHGALCSEEPIEIPGDLLTRLDAEAYRTHGDRTTVVIAALEAYLTEDAVGSIQLKTCDAGEED